MKTKIFYDLGATSVSRNADPVSIGLVAITDTKLTIEKIQETINKSSDAAALLCEIQKSYKPEIKTFYAEFTDFNIDKADNWVKKNIIDKLQFKHNIHHVKGSDTILQGPTSKISNELKQWLSQFESIEFWADFDVIDKPMLIDLIAEHDYNSYIKERTDVYYSTTEKFKSFVEEFSLPDNLYDHVTENGKDYQLPSPYGRGQMRDLKTIKLRDKLYVCAENTKLSFPVWTENEDIVLETKLVADVFFMEWVNETFTSEYKVGLPKHLPNIRYDQFFDLHTLFKIKGVDTDISRIEFIGDLIKEIPEGQVHNALYDSYINQRVYEKLLKI